MKPQSSPGIAPVLLVPRVFERDLCRRLVASHEAARPLSSLSAEVERSLFRSLGPMLRRAYQFHLHTVCEASVRTQDAGAATAASAAAFHCHVSLNAGAFQGGEFVFPEFGERSYRLPIGGALVFRSGLLQRSLPVTDGLSYIFQAGLAGGSVPPASALAASAADRL